MPQSTGVGRKVGSAPQRSDPGKVSASDSLTLDLCNPCARIQRRVSLSDSQALPLSVDVSAFFQSRREGLHRDDWTPQR